MGTSDNSEDNGPTLAELTKKYGEHEDAIVGVKVNVDIGIFVKGPRKLAKLVASLFGLFKL